MVFLTVLSPFIIMPGQILPVAKCLDLLLYSALFICAASHGVILLSKQMIST